MDKSKKIAWTAIVTLIFVIIVIVELCAEYFANKQLVYIAKPLITVLVAVLYLINSSEKSSIFLLSLFFGLLSTILFIPNDPTSLLWGVSVFAVHRIFLIIFLIKLLQKTDYFPIIIASMPVLIIFSYLVTITADLDATTLIIFSVNNILIAFFSGIVVANYMMKDEDNNTWLLISSLMFIALQLIVYIEKFYLLEFSPKILRPTAVLFLAMAMFTLVRGVLSQERLNSNTSS